MKYRLSHRVIDHIIEAVLIEAVLIFASVFLAFWLNDYRESKHNEANLKIFLQNIATEMTYNHKRIEKVFDYHYKIYMQIDSISKLANTGWENQYSYQLNGWYGLQMPAPRTPT